MKKSNAMQCFSKYEKFFDLLSEAHTKDKPASYKRLVAELLNVYIQNNDSFPAMFYINGEFPESVIASTINTLCGQSVEWITKSAPPRLNKNPICVKMDN